MVGSSRTVKEPLPPSGGVMDAAFSCNDALSVQGCMGRKDFGPECIYADPKSSNSYVQCTEGVAYTVQCSVIEVYNDKVKACE